MLRRDLPLAATVAVAVVNGLDFSPVFDSVSYWLYTFARESPLFDGDLFYYLTSVAITLMTLLLAGIPAAIYERIRGLQQSTPGSLAIWLAGDGLAHAAGDPAGAGTERGLRRRLSVRSWSPQPSSSMWRRRRRSRPTCRPAC